MPRPPRHPILAALLAAAASLVPAPALVAAGHGIEALGETFALPNLSAAEDIQISADRMGADHAWAPTRRPSA